MRRALPRRRTRLMLLAAVAACLLLTLVAAQGAFADAFTPESGGSDEWASADLIEAAADGYFEVARRFCGL